MIIAVPGGTTVEGFDKEVRGGKEKSECEHKKDYDSGVWQESQPDEEVQKGPLGCLSYRNKLEIQPSMVAVCFGCTRYSVLLTLNAPIPAKFVCFSCLLKFLRSLYGNSVYPDQTAPIGAVCSGSMLFASILISSVMLGNYLQQTTSADNIFKCIFFLVL